MKRTAVIAGVVAVVLVVGLLAFVQRPVLAFGHPGGFGMMGRAGMHGMGAEIMGAGATGCPVGMGATLTPEQREEQARAFAEHYIKQFLPGYALEKKASGS
jgi:hypothetical protein